MMQSFYYKGATFAPPLVSFKRTHSLDKWVGKAGKQWAFVHAVIVHLKDGSHS
jgi:hypothetical protein